MTEEQTERCRKVFEKFDTNNDGVIELSELKKGLMELGNFSDEDVLEIMGEADSDKNGVIDEKEFREYASEVFIKVKEDVREDKITALFLVSPAVAANLVACNLHVGFSSFSSINIWQARYTETVNCL